MSSKPAGLVLHALLGTVWQVQYRVHCPIKPCSSFAFLPQVMLNAREVAFPSRPAVSAEAKDFIRRCACWFCLLSILCGCRLLLLWLGSSPAAAAAGRHS